MDNERSSFPGYFPGGIDQVDPSTRTTTGAISISEQIKPEEHHKQCELCMTRAKYRQGKEYKAVKVYTVNQESCHLILQNIPAIGLGAELKKLCGTFGQVHSFELIPNYPAFEEFTESFYVKYSSLKEARFAKKKLDNRSFYGGLIHICYAPELETVQECREKLKQREAYVRRYVDPYTLSLTNKGKEKDSQSGCSKSNRKSATNLFSMDSATKPNATDQKQTAKMFGPVKMTTLPPRIGSPSTSTSVCKKPESESKDEILLSSRGAKGKPKHLQAYMWKLQKGSQKQNEKNEIRGKESSSLSVCESESEKVEIAIAPQHWARTRTGQKTTFANPQLIQSSISAPSCTKTAKEFGKEMQLQEAFPNSTAGTSYSASATSTSSAMHLLSRTDRDSTLPLTTYSPSSSSSTSTTASTSALVSQAESPTSFFDRTSKEPVLFRQTQRQSYNQIKPKPLSERRIVFHIQKKRTEEDCTTDRTRKEDDTSNKRKKEDDRDGNL